MIKNLIEVSQGRKTVLTPVLLKYQDEEQFADKDQPQQTTSGSTGNILQGKVLILFVFIKTKKISSWDQISYNWKKLLIEEKYLNKTDGLS